MVTVFWDMTSHSTTNFYRHFGGTCSSERGGGCEFLRNMGKYREDFYSLDEFTDRCTAGREAHANFANESAYLTAGNVRNEVVTVHKS
jgi:hypothetical protein